MIKIGHVQVSAQSAKGIFWITIIPSEASQKSTDVVVICALRAGHSPAPGIIARRRDVSSFMFRFTDMKVCVQYGIGGWWRTETLASRGSSVYGHVHLRRWVTRVYVGFCPFDDSRFTNHIWRQFFQVSNLSSFEYDSVQLSQYGSEEHRVDQRVIW